MIHLQNWSIGGSFEEVLFLLFLSYFLSLSLSLFFLILFFTYKKRASQKLRPIFTGYISSTTIGWIFVKKSDWLKYICDQKCDPTCRGSRDKISADDRYLEFKKIILILNFREKIIIKKSQNAFSSLEIARIFKFRLE